MFNIIKSDLFRIFKGKAIYICIVLVLVMSAVSVVSLSPGYLGLSVGSSMDASDIVLMEELSQCESLGEYRQVVKNQGSFPLDKDMVGTNINLYYVFIVVAVCVLATDFSNKSIKNTVSSAITRKEYYFAKLCLMLGLGTGFILLNNYFSYFLNLIVNGKNFASDFWEIAKVTVIQLPLLYGIISLLVCFAFVFRKTAIFNAVSIPFIMAVQLIGMTVISMLKIDGELFYNYELQFALRNLSTDPANDYIVKCVILGIAYVLIFNLIGYFSFKKAEIK